MKRVSIEYDGKFAVSDNSTPERHRWIVETDGACFLCRHINAAANLAVALAAEDVLGFAVNTPVGKVQ